MMGQVRLLGVLLLVGLVVLSAGCNVFAQQPTIASEVVYGETEGVKLVLDVYRCTTPGLHPALVMIHGGGWRSGDKASNKGMATYLSTKGGITCFSLNYRLAPQFKFPAQVLDCARAVRWVRAHAAEYGVDPERLGALGGSAGGHLSLMLGVMDPDAFQSPDDPNRALSAKVQCVVSTSGPTDLSGDTQWSDAAKLIAADFLGCIIADDPAKYAQASPLTYVTADDAPTLLVHGDKDGLVPLQQSEAMKAALDKVGVANELIVVAGGDHGFKGADPTEVSKAFQAMGKWLQEKLKAGE